MFHDMTTILWNIIGDCSDLDPLKLRLLMFFFNKKTQQGSADLYDFCAAAIRWSHHKISNFKSYLLFNN
jgi:hypothetical protein